ncbi:MAG: type VI secretion system baseplate subunit TssG [Bryobacteraceae bacterium]|nr:type VI secretion system baseplate subunit TssG [Bryobacteraceae bacterium]MDW8377368.1 type VI secretion system baseplate subunit TssG [Bryobacterales bacterium]
MASESRTADPVVALVPLRYAIQSEPWTFSFFQLVRLLQRMLGRRELVGRFHPPSREVARFGAHASLAFPASEIQELVWEEGDRPVQIRVNFMGLYGPLGALPLYYTEYILQRLRAKDTALAAFLDIFNHRIISLFYRAWEKYRFYVCYERGERDRMSQYLMDLIGIGTRGLSGRLEVRDEALLYYTGLLSLLPRSALALEQLLSDFFDVPVQVEQFYGAWFPLERKSQCQFLRGDSYSEQLGVGVIVGDEVYDPQSGVRIRLGPLTLAQYLEFLPNGSAFRPLKALTQFFSNGELAFQAQLVLRREEVPPCELGAGGEAGPQLGWVTWIRNAPLGRDPEDTLLAIS